MIDDTSYRSARDLTSSPIEYAGASNPRKKLLVYIYIYIYIIKGLLQSGSVLRAIVPGSKFVLMGWPTRPQERPTLLPDARSHKMSTHRYVLVLSYEITEEY
jgi:hypothetical protein